MPHRVIFGWREKGPSREGEVVMKLLMTAPAIQAKMAAPPIIAKMTAAPIIAKMEAPAMMSILEILEELTMLLEAE